MNYNFDSFTDWYTTIRDIIRDTNDYEIPPKLFSIISPYKIDITILNNIAGKWKDFYDALPPGLLFTKFQLGLLKLDFIYVHQGDGIEARRFKQRDYKDATDFLELVMIADMKSEQLSSINGLMDIVVDEITLRGSDAQKKWLSNFEESRSKTPENIFLESPGHVSPSGEEYTSLSSNDQLPIVNQIVNSPAPIMTRFPFLDSTPPSELFCSVFQKRYLECLVVTNVFSDEIAKINQMRYEEAWRYCDERIFIPQFDIRRSAYRNEYSDKSEYFLNSIRELLENRDKQKEQIKNNSSPIIEDQMKSILSKLKDLEINLISSGVSHPVVERVAPPFVPSVPLSTSASKTTSSKEADLVNIFKF